MGNWIDGLTERGILENYVGRIGPERMSARLVKILRSLQNLQVEIPVWCEIGYVDPEFERSLN